MGVLGLLVLALSFGCLGSRITPCGNAYCPEGRACHLPTMSCYGTDQLAACEGLSTDSPCSLGGLNGYCRDGICLGAVCGDGVVHDAEECDEGPANSDEPDAACRPSCRFAICGDGIVDTARGEICDDGNVESLDSCAPDCGSDQTCGNGVLDLGEGCDDGNANVRDGCSGCRDEQLISQVANAGNPRNRLSAAMAYDAARQRLVVFGGRNASVGLRADTWEYDGVRWREIPTVTAPTARAGMVAVYDAARARIVLFGGDDGTKALDDMWEYDGGTWVELTPAVRPPPRKYFAMTYDSATKRIVLFGGSNSSTMLDDTWVWDGAGWTEITAQSTPPPAMDEVAMAYDAIGNRIVMFGGRKSVPETATSFDGGTYILTGTSWSTATVTFADQYTTGPAQPTLGAARSGVAMVWDAVRGKIVMANGRYWNTAGVVGAARELWELTGTTWTRIGAGPPGNYGMLAYDSTRRELDWLFGQSMYIRTATPPTPPTTFTFRFFASAAPPPRYHAAVAFDPKRGRLVLYGGAYRDLTTYESVAYGDTWEWDGASWINMTPSSGPGLRDHAALAFDYADGTMLLTGGWDPTQASFDARASTWRWSPGASSASSTWAQIGGTDPLLARRAHSMAFDAKRNVMMLYGGRSTDYGYDMADDLLEWNGASWTEVNAASTPGNRQNFSMVFDPVRGSVVVAPGRSIVTNNNKPYSFDGTTWSELPGAGVAGRGGGLVFNPIRKSVVWIVDPELVSTEYWELVGSTWSRRLVYPSLPSTYDPAVAYDPLRSELVVFGGRDSGYAALGTTMLVWYQPNRAGEACVAPVPTMDYDRDGLPGCMDPECDARCRYLGSLTCGNGTCDPLEDCRWCASDCGSCAGDGDCGDLRCVAPETVASCPGDCSP